MFVLDGRLQLANGGETLELRRPGGDLADTAVYHNAPTSAVRDFEAGEWRPVGATDLEPRRVEASSEATVFVLPDAPDLTVETIRGAADRILLGGYTLTSVRVAEALAVAVRVPNTRPQRARRTPVRWAGAWHPPESRSPPNQHV